MQRRYTLALATVVLLTLMIGVDAQAQIAFVSNRSGNWDIYVMDADGGNPQNLTNNPFAHDRQPV
ncbi:PD40 domain-containing protein [Candidatus Poribacteria bacterium]|nr:PD40 domain-containing protein [Candidatus Poribacteria bacterium]